MTALGDQSHRIDAETFLLAPGQRLHLPRSGRLSAAQVNQAWKRCAAEHHPDRGGTHDTMQLVNGARDLLLSRDLS